MKLKQEFVLRTIVGETVLIPVGNLEDEFQGIITLNETGKFIWEKLVEGKEPEKIAEDMAEIYDVTKEQAYSDIDEICGQLKKLGIYEQ